MASAAQMPIIMVCQRVINLDSYYLHAEKFQQEAAKSRAEGDLESAKGLECIARRFARRYRKLVDNPLLVEA